MRRELRKRLSLRKQDHNWLHHFLHSFDLLERRSTVLFLPVAASLLALYTVPWLLFGRREITLLIAALFFVDCLILFLQPRLRISFPAFTSQLAIISAPRLLVLLFYSLSALFFEQTDWILLVGMSAGSILYAWGMLGEPALPVVIRRRLASPAIHEPFTFFHLSDLHLERRSCREEFVLRMAEKHKPDFIFLTGDFLNLSHVEDPVSHREMREFLKKLTKHSQVIGTLGSPPVDRRSILPPLLEDAGVVLLRDRILRLPLGNGNFLNILGIDCDHHPTLDAEVLRSLLGDVSDSDLNLLLYHSPEIMPAVKDSPIDLYLCGHTHGGQIRLPLYGALVTSSVTGKRYEKGLYREGRIYLYVSPGIGLEGRLAPRMRLFCRPEIGLWEAFPTTEKS